MIVDLSLRGKVKRRQEKIYTLIVVLDRIRQGFAHLKIEMRIENDRGLLSMFNQDSRLQD